MTLERAIQLAKQWSTGGVCTLTEGEAEEYHKLCLEALTQRTWINFEETKPDLGAEVLGLYLKGE